MIAILVILTIIVLFIFIFLAILVGYILGLSRGAKRIIRFTEKQFMKVNDYIDMRISESQNQ